MTVTVRITQYVLGLPRPAKQAIVLLGDAFLCAASVYVAYYLRTNTWPDRYGSVWYPTITSIALALPLFVVSGLYRTIFRYAGPAALATIVKVVAVYALPFAVVYSFVGIAGVPRTIGLLQPILLLLLVVSSRALASSWLGRAYIDTVPVGKQPRVLIYGAGASGRQISSALQVSGQVQVVGFLDDDRSIWKATINGLRVHAPQDLNLLVGRYGVTDVLLAINRTSRARSSEIIAQLKRSGLHVRAMPGVDQLARGTVSFSDLKELDIEDLLGRPSIPPHIDLMTHNVSGKIVLVTGAGGSIGSEISRQIIRLDPVMLLLVDISEFNLYSIHQELLKLVEKLDKTTIVPLLASVRDKRRIDEIVGTWHPHTIYHAAAYKHVPLVEHNVLDALANNVLGTLNVAIAARSHGVESFVLISTDKAVRPTNVMGASKRLAEIIIQSLSADGLRGIFSLVRFGNVLGSSGSVVPLFRSQIASGGPITITHPEITRYFMTIPEAAQLVIQAGAMAVSGDVFVLDMGEPVKIVDLAHTMIELSGLSVQGPNARDGDIAIQFVGLRPGEKLFEELLIGSNPTPSAHPRILRAQEPFIVWPTLRIALERLQEIICERDSDAARTLLRELVSEFAPTGHNVDFVSLESAKKMAIKPHAAFEPKGSSATHNEHPSYQENA